MLFNAPEFILAFLPVTLAVFFLLGRLGLTRLCVVWLVLASVFFYGWWNPPFAGLLLGSLAFNFWAGRRLLRAPTKGMLVFAIGANLAALGWFKYAGFLALTIDQLTGLGLPIPEVILPLGISFYTFQQVGYLVDAHDGLAEEAGFWDYALFISFFPQLVAGPIVHHREVLTQFRKEETFRPNLELIAVGLTVFVIGLAKKVLLADNLSPIVAGVFGPAQDGVAPDMVDAWVASLAYALQLYFDFSGYSDMAIGLGLMFGIRLPINFFSPFKAASIIEFWSRWHITLTRFITAYIYNPLTLRATKARMLAGKPPLRKNAPKAGPFLALLAWPTMATMTIAGIWHGAGWQFLIFGLLHGAYITINHAWRAVRQVRKIGPEQGRRFRALGVGLTFLCVLVSFVFFRSASVEHALTILGAMAGLGPHGFMTPANIAHVPKLEAVQILTAFAIVWGLPNTVQWLGLSRWGIEDPSGAPPAAARRRYLPTPRWRPTLAYGAALGVVLCLTLVRAFSVTPTEFLYFTF